MPLPLADLRPLPTRLGDADLMAAEGPSMYWHMKNINNFALSAERNQQGSSTRCSILRLLMSKGVRCVRAHLLNAALACCCN